MATRTTPTDGIAATMRLLALSDSQCPVGTFSFSNGLEAAVYTGMVGDARSLAEYVAAAVRQALRSDGIAALVAHRAADSGDYATILRADTEVMLCKLNAEARRMTLRMGRKLAQLTAAVAPPSDTVGRLLDDITAGATPGSYPVVHAVAMQAAGVLETEMLASQAFGVANMVVGAALRCMRVSHYDTQRILHDLAPTIAGQYREVSALGLDDMQTFAPGIDIAASLHEKGSMRMFMS